MENKSAYKKQTYLSFFQFGSEVINFFVIAVSAFLSKSLIMWMDLINSSGNTMRTGLTAFFSRRVTKNLRDRYNYGIDKVEAMVSLFCDCFVFIGLIATLIFSVIELFAPRQQSNHLIIAVGIKLICVICDTPMLYFQYKIKKENSNRVSDSNMIATFGAFLFDVAAFLSLLAVWLTRDLPLARYVSPALSIIIAVTLLGVCIKHIIDSISDLTDKALPEHDQMKIFKIVAKNTNAVDKIESIKTRHNGLSVCVDISFNFDEEQSYGEIKELKDKLQAALEKEIEGCTLTILIE